ncbi:hypothetical protein [Sphingomonas koreensis]
MTELPHTLRRAPTLFYAAAIIMFGWSMTMTYYETVSLSAPYDAAADHVVRLVLLKGLYQAALEGIYMAANGAVIHVLLAIWSRLAQSQTGAGTAE